MRIGVVAASLVAALGVAGLIRGAVAQSPASSGSPASDAGPIVVTNAYVRAPVPPSRTAAAYFTVSEALANVAKYACARRAWVDVEHAGDHLRVEVGDDGAGGANIRPGCGLQGLRDRVSAAGGVLTIDSEPGAGTRISFVLDAWVPSDSIS